jgi:tRNA pseudouridine38-40 synthase
MPRYKLTVAYDGTNFHGWQKQQRSTEVPDSESPGSRSHGIAIPWLPLAEGSATIRTVQGVLEEAVREVVRENVNVLGASRTDARVHARGQVAAFTTSREIPVKKLPRAISSRLSDDVQVRKAEIVPDDFDPIRGAIAKGYRYRIAFGCRPGKSPLFGRNFITTTAYRLDPALMNDAARELMGEHDFASFTRIAHGRESTVRTIYDCRVTEIGKRGCQIDVAGNGFLYNMIRIIAGTLLEIGRGKIDPEEIGKILKARDRNAAGPTLPPNGLCLMWIKYPELPGAARPA